MRCVGIPGTDLTCSGICLGTSQMGSTIPKGEAFAMLDAFAEAGGDFIDTAACYADWMSYDGESASEGTIGEWLESRDCRDAFTIGTKGGHPRFHPSTGPRLTPGELWGDLESSLEKLGTDRIDIYWLHRDDPRIPVEEIMGTLAEMSGKGLIRYAACSNWGADRIALALGTCARNGWPPFVADQMLWNMAVVDADAIGDPTIVTMNGDLFDLHSSTGMAAIPFSGQANGLFARMEAGTLDSMNPLHQRMYADTANTARYRVLKETCLKRGLTINQGVLGYLAGQPFPTIPIVGCRTPGQLADTLTAADIVLAPGEIDAINRAK